MSLPPRRVLAVSLLIALPIVAVVVAGVMRSSPSLELSRLSYQLSGRELTVSARVTNSSSKASEVRIWYFIAAPGDARPWLYPVVKSRTMQREIAPGAAIDVSWHDQLAVPAGTFELSAWVHVGTESGFEHAAGQFAPQLIDATDPEQYRRTVGADQLVSIDSVNATRSASSTSCDVQIRNDGTTAETVEVTWGGRGPDAPEGPLGSAVVQVPAGGMAGTTLQTSKPMEGVPIWVEVRRDGEADPLDRIAVDST